MIPCLSPNGQLAVELEAPADRLLVGSASGIVRLRRIGSGQRWVEEGRALVGSHIGAIINAPGGRLFAGCHFKGGVFRSLDEGVTWEQVGQSITATDIFSLALMEAPEGPAILAGVEPVSLFRSNDFGETWQEFPSIGTVPGAENWTFPPPPHIPHLKSFAMPAERSNTFYACVEQGALLRTDDAGQTWTELPAMWKASDPVYNDAHRVTVLPWNKDVLIFASGIGVYRSEDRGVSWTRCGQVSEYNKYPDALVASPRDRTIFVGGPADFPVDWLGGDPSGTLCRSEDDGATWQRVDHGLPQNRQANIEGLSIASHPDGYSLFVGDTDGRIFTSNDRGDSWEQIATIDAVSKGAHHKIAQLSHKLPRWAGPGATLVFKKVAGFTQGRAAVKRKADFAKRAAGQ